MDPGHWKELDMVEADASQASSHTSPYVSKAWPAIPFFSRGRFPAFHTTHLHVARQLTLKHLLSKRSREVAWPE